MVHLSSQLFTKSILHPLIKNPSYSYYLKTFPHIHSQLLATLQREKGGQDASVQDCHREPRRARWHLFRPSSPSPRTVWILFKHFSALRFGQERIRRGQMRCSSGGGGGQTKNSFLSGVRTSLFRKDNVIDTNARVRHNICKNVSRHRPH